MYVHMCIHTSTCIYIYIYTHIRERMPPHARRGLRAHGGPRPRSGRTIDMFDSLTFSLCLTLRPCMCLSIVSYIIINIIGARGVRLQFHQL